MLWMELGWKSSVAAWGEIWWAHYWNGDSDVGPEFFICHSLTPDANLATDHFTKKLDLEAHRWWYGCRVTNDSNLEAEFYMTGVFFGLDYAWV